MTTADPTKATPVVSTSIGIEERPILQRVSAIFREFTRELRGVVPSGRMNFLENGHEEALGADFIFCLEVRREDYAQAVDVTSQLEARYFERYGVNFVVIPEVL